MCVCVRVYHSLYHKETEPSRRQKRQWSPSPTSRRIHSQHIALPLARLAPSLPLPPPTPLLDTGQKEPFVYWLLRTTSRLAIDLAKHNVLCSNERHNVGQHVALAHKVEAGLQKSRGMAA